MLSPARPATSSRYDACVLPVLVHCEEHLAEPLSLADLARVAGFSPYHFHRVFRHVTGEAPMEYVRRLRLERAVYRLKGSHDTVVRIAHESGFTTHETFTRAFTRRFGMSPSRFRDVLRTYRDCAGVLTGSRTVDGFTDDTPLTLRFDLHQDVVRVVRAPGRHLLFVRHLGFDGLAARGGSPLALWDDVLDHARRLGLAEAPTTLVAITHDDPYVTDEHRVRVDACVPVPGPVAAGHPFGYRYLPPALCVVRRHHGGLEEVARTFAGIGVAWLPTAGYGLGAAPPFEVHTVARAGDGALEQVRTDAHVPLEPTARAQEEQHP